MRRIHHRTSISPDRVPWRRRIAEAGTGALLAAGMVAAASGPAAAGGLPVLACGCAASGLASSCTS